ncbi:AbfB domain-containing protein [Streptomyces sp. S.PB5]|uniref:AbfB domain-containing protein n=1 Tax=Streptomyces sp. S.PB5 TaxID=3020844 RepID=UPI0025B1E1A4|nr:AbfB domain-containing protein [Streptomyces sp. S.PB5]MDN3021075.1 AbfB domain-containing protein [Streptomyces sp. S.PB5]
MPQDKSQPPQDRPWETGWAPDTSRAPGTRRLYLAGALAVATVVACVTAISMTDGTPDAVSKSAPPTDAGTLPGLAGYASPSDTTTLPPKGKSGLATSEESASAAPAQQGNSPAPVPAATSKSPSSKPSSSPPKPPVKWRSIRSANYPDRYWHVNGGYVKLDRVGGSESREDSTFKLVKGLANSACYSFATHDGKYLRHRSFVLIADTGDGSSLFKQDATFCPRTSSVYGATMLESVNYPGRFLRHQNFQLKLEPYQQSDLYRRDSAFWLVDGLA